MTSVYPHRKKIEKTIIPIPITTFEHMVYYLISIGNINRRFLRNIIKLIEILNTTPYEQDGYAVFLIQAIELLGTIRYNGVSNSTIIKDELYRSNLDTIYIDKIYEIFNNTHLSKEDYYHLQIVIRDYVDYAFIYINYENILNHFNDIRNAQGKIIQKNIFGLKQELEKMLSNIRLADVCNTDDQYVCISGSKDQKELESEIIELYNDVNNPSMVFKTGLKELNRFLLGGFKRKSVSVFYGPTNSGKSLLLLHCALWIMQFNPDAQPKSKDKRLAIVLISLEMTTHEELDRIHAIFTNGEVNISAISLGTYKNQWERILHNLNSAFDFYIVRKNSTNFTTIDIETIVGEIESDTNSEIAVVIVDHLGNVQKSHYQDDEIKGKIRTAYEFSDWCKSSDRIGITAMHTNSRFDDILANDIAEGKHNLIRRFGRIAIADARYVDRAFDNSFYIIREWCHFDNSWYLGLKFEKIRGKLPNKYNNNFFYHRIENGIALAYDEGTDVCRSVPCIPGTENSIVRQQKTMPSSIKEPPPASMISPSQGVSSYMPSVAYKPPMPSSTVYNSPTDIKSNVPPFSLTSKSQTPTFSIDDETPIDHKDSSENIVQLPEYHRITYRELFNKDDDDDNDDLLYIVETSNEETFFEEDFDEDDNEYFDWINDANLDSYL